MSIVSGRTAVCPEPRTTGYTIAPNFIDSLGLTPREEQLVRRILKYRWTPDSVVFVRIAVLATEMHCHRRTVERAIDSLVGKGLLTVEARYRDDGGRAANRYILSSALTTVVMADGQCHDAAAVVPRSGGHTTPAQQQEHYSGKTTQRTGRTGGRIARNYTESRRGTIPRR
jgi:predicted ArsR family transcriptional regulator